ncbi:chromate transporter [Bacillus aquiflavi]|uniref:chromate transporter n=1 Tax=Bacillus aquiflavi TaxID=2672567 RepID=UPI001CA8016D|nr:chromate transporter [Bacillus aquiflavi]UAC47987.1 chromate transporter [Bacillus aquiflavi]
MKQRDIFFAFFRSGMLGYGGGPSSIPLIHKEVVDTFKWMDDDEFSDVLALANILPGPIATKLSGYIGWRIGGFLGMFNAIIASVLPTVLLLIALLTVLNTYKDKPWVQGMSQAVVPVVGVLIGVLTWDFIKKSHNTLGFRMASLFIIGSIIILELVRIHPAFLILGLLGAALIKRDKNKNKEKA